ncbi:transcription initiation factor IIE subunit alpha-like [Diospyros lotus]|uniref:transcription initiation factor IIE subunit alpha-like n=1 Tax=Diospyros lotus TaxID=55363 RepID=UPI002250F0F7|nr:transcription initiation factor IIE subunit alpha-like [Diospyros lotus]XP_052199068.1 transcription initiation factor IIE subunit alpha-like [Diospyros lotus]
MSIEPFNRLVKLTARAFYDDITTKGENQPKTGRSDNRGIAVVVLDALTRRQWVREDDLAKDLKLHSKQLRRTLRFFEEEKLVTRDHRKETAKGAKIYSAAIAATADGQQNGREGEEKIKLHTHSYCCLDYAQIYDVVRYRAQRMKKKLKDELENKNTVQEYICPNCGKRYNALDALRLVSFDDENFHCEHCNGELVAESDKLAAQEMGDGDDNARRRRREKLKDMLQKMEEQLKPLMDQLNRVRDLPVPEFGNLHAWELRANAAGRATGGDSSANDSSKSSHGLGFGTPMPFVGETKVEVAFSGVDEKGDIKSENASSPMKVLPPWMIKQGMNLTREQRGEAKEEMKMVGTSASLQLSDEKKSITEKDDVKNIQDEYVKAYYAALLQRQREQDEAAKRQQEFSNNDILNGVYGTSERQVGMKSKRDENEGDEDIWEEAAPAGNTGESYKVSDLNVQADASGDEEDDIWEEG